ncbi:MAG: PilZ domain-containing protein, partial [Desulfobulbales bacterium]|nr:PilZ domain-containing protein [Desulfobulbales bacterium]
LKIKCSCKNIFTVNLEFRKRVRKRTSLRGTYINHSQQNKRGSLVVKNISVSGLEFSTLDTHNFAVDDELTVAFNLDNEQRSEIVKEVTVKDIRQNSVGCEFERSGEFAFDGPLGFYIMS